MSRPSRSLNLSYSPYSLRASIILSSLGGSEAPRVRFVRTFVRSNTPFCGTTVTLDRNESDSRRETSVSSMTMEPFCIWTRPRIEAMSVLFPLGRYCQHLARKVQCQRGSISYLPVRPQIPTFHPGSILSVRFDMTGGKESLSSWNASVHTQPLTSPTVSEDSPVCKRNIAELDLAFARPVSGWS